MQNLLYFLYKYGFVLLFLSLELLCINLVVNYNPHQNKLFLKSSNQVSGWVLDKFQSVTQYFGLTKVAEELAAENAQLLRQNLETQNPTETFVTSTTDTIHKQQFELVAAKVINNSITGLDNFITLNKGAADGIKKGLGVIQSDGLIGILTDVNRNFSRGVSILHRDCRISAALSRNHFFGTLHWPGGDPRIVQLEDIPKHADLKIGDEIVTSGYSAIFPQGLPLGKIVDFSLSDGSNFYEIDVELSNDLSKINYVYVVRNLLKGEQIQLQGDTINESDIQ